ncbi:MAG: 1-acyl-sn-glycerol-3-phosphate acyltransferase [Planctomycetota bacterium]|jgi:1-acyl-sn-glycerol-3-phosphate acyltransferase
MSALRILYRMTLTGVGTTVFYSMWLLTRLSALVSARMAARTHAWIVKAWARCMLRILGIRLTVVGPIPRPPFFLVSNHLSYIDIPVMLSQLDGNFLAKADIAHWPVIGWLARSTGTLFINRTMRTDLKRVLPEVQRALDSGRGVIVFPEGTSSQGSEVLAFRPSIFEVPARTGIEVSIACVHYDTRNERPPAHLSVCWWGDMTFMPHFIDMMKMPGFEARLSFSSDTLEHDDRKALATQSHSAVKGLFKRVPESAMIER